MREYRSNGENGLKYQVYTGVQYNKFPGGEAETAAKKLRKDEVTDYIISHWPSVANYSYPSTGYINTMRATDNAIKKMVPYLARRKKYVTIDALLRLLELVQVKPRVYTKDFTYLSLKSHFLDVVNRNVANIRYEAMSGFPNIYMYATKGKEMDDTNKLWSMYYFMVEQLKDRVSDPVKMHNYVQSMFSLNNVFSMPFMIIQKNEPHENKKVAEGRFRTLQVCSTFLYIFAHYLFGDASMVDFWQQTYCASGMDSSTQEMRQQVRNKVKAWPGTKRTSSDISGYEWSTTKREWMYWVLEKAYKLSKITKVEIATYRGHTDEWLEEKFINHNDIWFRFAWACVCKNANPMVVYEDGSVMTLMGDEWSTLSWRNPSGHLYTADFGSSSRAMLEIQIGLDHGIKDIHVLSMGDDCVSTLPAEYLTLDAPDYGRIVKEELESDEFFEFCGYKHNIKNDTDEFMRVEKTLASFAYSTKTPEQWSGLYNVFENKVDLEKFPCNPWRKPQPCGNASPLTTGVKDQ